MTRMNMAVLVVSLLVLAGLPCAAQEVHQESKELYSTRKLKASASIRQGNKITIQAAASLRGSLTITVADVAQVELVYTKKAKTSGKSRAVDYIDLIAVALENIPDGAGLQMRAPNPPPWKGVEYGMVEAELTLPPDWSVDIDAVYFDLAATGPFTELSNSTSLGRLDVSHVTDRLDLSTANRRVNVNDISGRISVSTTNSTLVANNVTCPAEAATFRNDGGDILIDGLRGGVNARNSYGRVDIVGFKPHGSKSYIRCVSGPILVALTEMADGQLLINNRYEDIELEIPSDLSAHVALAVDDGGKIDVSEFNFKTELVEHNRLNLLAGAGIGLISGSVRGKGNIYVRGIEYGE